MPHEWAMMREESGRLYKNDGNGVAYNLRDWIISKNHPVKCFPPAGVTTPLREPLPLLADSFVDAEVKTKACPAQVRACNER
jgi:hypothetical protein